jgi:hypothetical protein
MLITTKSDSRTFGESNNIGDVDGLRLSCKRDDGSEHFFDGVISFDTDDLVVVRRLSPYDNATESVTLREVIVRFYRNKSMVAMKTIKRAKEDD